MTGKLIAVANMKGGVGKTTTVVMLAEALAADGARVLVVDLDPQASVSVCLAGPDLLWGMIAQGRTLEAYLALKLIAREKPSLAARIHGQVSLTTHKNEPLALSLLPSGPYLRMVEREIIYELTGQGFAMHAIEGRLWKLFQNDIAPLAADYDYVLFDCAPGISPMTEVVVRGADLVLVTSIPDFLSTYGLNAFVETIWRKSGRQSGQSVPKARPTCSSRATSKACGSISRRWRNCARRPNPRMPASSCSPPAFRRRRRSRMHWCRAIFRRPSPENTTSTSRPC